MCTFYKYILCHYKSQTYCNYEFTEIITTVRQRLISLESSHSYVIVAQEGDFIKLKLIYSTPRVIKKKYFSFSLL